MAAGTICSDFGAQNNKVWHCFYCFPIYFPWSDGAMCGVCFSLSDLFHSVWQTVDPSMSLANYLSQLDVNHIWDCFFFFFSFFPVSYVVWFKKHFSYKLRYSWPSTIYQKAMPFPTTLKYSFLLWIKWLSLFESVLDSLTKWSNNLYLQLYHLALIFVAL